MLDDVRSDIRQLADRKLRFKMGVRRELKHLPDILAEQEQVLNMAAGQYDGRQGLLVVTERRMVFFAKSLARSRQEDFLYSKVTSIQTSTSMMSGSLVVFVSGNKAVINQVLPKERVGEIGEYVRARISDSPPGPPAQPATEGSAERLRKLKRLYDDGLISDEEFKAKRERALADL